MLTIQLMQSFDGAYHQTWQSPTFEAFTKELNPLNDPVIAQFQLLRFNLLRSCAIYDEESRRLYWQYMSRHDRDLAEALYDSYKSQAEDVFVAEMLYLRDKAQQQINDFVTKGIPDAKPTPEPKIRPDAITDIDWNRGMLRSDIYPAFAPMGTPFGHRYLDSFYRPGSVELQAAIALPVDRGFYTQWRNQQSLHQMNQMISSNMLAYDLSHAANTHNALSGQTAHVHTLLVNDGVPLPNHATFLAWASHCCFGFSKLERFESQYYEKLCGFKPELLVTYLVPCLSRTKEHLASSLIKTDDSGADYSLPSKSAGHKRDQWGNIQYGEWSIRTVLLGENEEFQSYLIAESNLSSLDMDGHYTRLMHERMVPLRIKSAKQYPFSGLHSKEFIGLVWSIGFDPDLSAPFRLSPVWSFNRSLDTAFRSVSKFTGVHFRFDTDEEGNAASEKWKMAFEICALSHSRMNQTDINRWNLKAGVTVSKDAATPIDLGPKGQKHKHDGGRFRVDLSKF